ncbi:amidase signature domain-containing protein [Xylariomycetidae sp. FL2044]|nr:amidase signature domain-containing protein [Xylariomycetidae sp. FL2044]
MDAFSPSEDWKTRAARKQAERSSKIPPEFTIPKSLLPSAEEKVVQDFPHKAGFFTERELLITESTASEVVSKIAHGEWTALEVARATCKRAAVAQQLVNCLTEIVFEQAYTRAAELDEYYKKNGHTVGPLHGLPVSLKDQFNLEGVDSTIGYASWVDKKPTEESTLVKLLRDAGAVFYVKTNVPTTLMMGESVNNLFGRTVNPRNRALTTGGSSGGESALITFRGSYLGVGTDIGGSIRHPASYTGLYALRPSHGRVSYQQVTNTFLGQEAVRSCAGPLCRSPEDIRLFMSSVAALKPWERDPQVVPLPWRQHEEDLPKKLCFGFGMGDGYVTPSPPLRRAMEITKTKLLAAGHNVIDFLPYETKEAYEIISRMWTADGGEEIRRDSGATGEPLPAIVEGLYGHSNKSLKPSSVFETWQNQQRRALLAQRFLERWQKTAGETGMGRPIDGLITPSTPFPAIRHDTRYKWNYGVLSPLLDLTTGVFPVTTVDLEKDVIPSDWKAISEKDQEVMELYGRPENHENALVGLALIGRRLEEEKVTALLKVLEDVVGVDY